MYLRLLLQVFLWHVLLHIQNASAIVPDILEPPESVRVGLNAATLNCRIRGDNLYWAINGTLLVSSTTSSFRNKGITGSRSMFSGNEVSASLTVNARSGNNNTVVVCKAQAAGQMTVSSDSVSVFIAGVPFPVEPVFSVVNVSTIKVEWEAPFSWDDFPITSYTVRVTNKTSQELLVDDQVLGPDALSYSLTQTALPSCTDLNFSVSVSNSVGTSSPGITQGAFPFRPGVFLESPRSEITYSRDQSPILTVDFTFPFLCFYHNATYHMVIEDSGAMLVHTLGPEITSWRESNSSLFNIELREVGLQLHMAYNATITVSTLAGDESISFTFNTFLPTDSSTGPVITDPSTGPVITDPSTGPVITDPRTGPVIISGDNSPQTPSTDPLTTSNKESDNVLEIALAVVGTALLMIVIGLGVVCGIYVYNRSVRRKRDCINTTELASNSRPMVQNPIYDGTAIYEEIPGDRKNFRSLPQPALPPLPGCAVDRDECYVSITNPIITNGEDFDFLASEKADLSSIGSVGRRTEDTYTVMNSAGSLMNGNSAAAAVSVPGQQPGVACNYPEGDAGASATKSIPEPDHENRYIVI